MKENENFEALIQETETNREAIETEIDQNYQYNEERNKLKGNLVHSELAEMRVRLVGQDGFRSFKCKYCLELLRQPVKLWCLHNICLECLLECLIVERQVQIDANHYFQKNVFENKVVCPVCSSFSQLPSSELELRNFQHYVQSALNQQMSLHLAQTSLTHKVELFQQFYNKSVVVYKEELKFSSVSGNAVLKVYLDERSKNRQKILQSLHFNQSLMNPQNIFATGASLRQLKFLGSDREKSKFRTQAERHTSQIDITNLQLCQLCPPDKKFVSPAGYKCSNCLFVSCLDCMRLHVSNQQFKHHHFYALQLQKNGSQFLEAGAPSPDLQKILQNSIIGDTLCAVHKQPCKLYCFDDQQAICIICGQYEEEHKLHEIKPVEVAIQEALKERNSLESTVRGSEKLIAQNQAHFINALAKLDNQETLFLEKVERDFQFLRKMVENKRAEMREEIRDAFQKAKYSFRLRLQTFTLLQQRLQKLWEFRERVDVEVVSVVKQLKQSIMEVVKLDTEFNNDADLGPSLFSQESYSQMDRITRNYCFTPIRQLDLKFFASHFNGSKIIDRELRNNVVLSIFKDLFIESTHMLYSMSKNGLGCGKFHNHCDGKGPTILLIRTEDNHVFGGYNPYSWRTDHCYQQTDEAFLFSLDDGKGREAKKCPLRRGKSGMAIKQNQAKFSPGFGESNHSDLFISFKSPKSSYSKLGNVYKCPRGYQGTQFLAGKATDWDVREIEVWRVKLLPNGPPKRVEGQFLVKKPQLRGEAAVKEEIPV